MNKKLILGVILVLLAIWTVIPWQASKANLVGYYSHCTFTPISTVILLAIAAALLLKK